MNTEQLFAETLYNVNLAFLIIPSIILSAFLIASIVCLPDRIRKANRVYRYKKTYCKDNNGWHPSWIRIFVFNIYELDYCEKLTWKKLLNKI